MRAVAVVNDDWNLFSESLSLKLNGTGFPLKFNGSYVKLEHYTGHVGGESVEILDARYPGAHYIFASGCVGSIKDTGYRCRQERGKKVPVIIGDNSGNGFSLGRRRKSKRSYW